MVSWVNLKFKWLIKKRKFPVILIATPYKVKNTKNMLNITTICTELTFYLSIVM